MCLLWSWQRCLLSFSSRANVLSFFFILYFLFYRFFLSGVCKRKKKIDSSEKNNRIYISRENRICWVWQQNKRAKMMFGQFVFLFMDFKDIINRLLSKCLPFFFSFRLSSFVLHIFSPCFMSSFYYYCILLLILFYMYGFVCCHATSSSCLFFHTHIFLFSVFFSVFCFSFSVLFSCSDCRTSVWMSKALFHHL